MKMSHIVGEDMRNYPIIPVEGGRTRVLFGPVLRIHAEKSRKSLLCIYSQLTCCIEATALRTALSDYGSRGCRRPA